MVHLLHPLGSDTWFDRHLADADLHRAVEARLEWQHLPETSAAEPFWQALAQRVEATAASPHPTLVQPLSLCDVEGRRGLLCDHVYGDTWELAVRTRRPAAHPLWPRVVDGGRRLADGLEHLLRVADPATGQPLGLIHHDLQPTWARLTPTGVVKLASVELPGPWLADGGPMASGGHASVLMSNPAYHSPEQAQAFGTTTESNVFTLGVMLYTALTGQHPFRTGAGSGVAIMMNIVYTDPPPPSTLDPTIPPEVDRVVGRAMAKRPDERYPTPGEMALALAELLETVDEPDVLTLDVNGALSWAREKVGEGDLALLSSLLDVRPDLTGSPQLVDYLWHHAGQRLEARHRANRRLGRAEAALMWQLKVAMGTVEA